MLIIHLFPLVPRGVAPLALLLQLLEGRVPGPPVVDGGGHAGVARGEGGEVQLQVEEHLDIACILIVLLQIFWCCMTMGTRPE